MKHFHPNPRNGSHIFYSIASAATISHYVRCPDGSDNCTPAILANAADMFNPLSGFKDILDTLEELDNIGGK
jgi:hypothetical protein